MTNFAKIINVIPLVPVGLNRPQIFTYLVPLKLQGVLRPGQLLKIPFGHKTVLAVSSSFEMHRLAKETKGLKALYELIEPSPVLSEKNLALANFMAEYYVCPLGLAVKIMLPDFRVKPRILKLVGFEKFNPGFVLNEAQRHAVSHISSRLERAAAFLVHGITASGKTEVYMRVVERILEGGKQALMLVPEISLTQAAVERFARRFGIERVAILHSGLKDSERLYMWQEIREGKRQIVIGTRSAVFAPFQNLGLIVMDEEHDNSYKQWDQTPKYHAREVAGKIAELWECPLIMGDATPSVETYYRALQGKITLLPLPHRVKADVGLPKVTLIDMRREVREAKGLPILSEFLKFAILDNLRRKKQIILFLNRRGAANFVMCRDCGEVLRCPNCSVSLVWHKAKDRLLCHHCGWTALIPPLCLKCKGSRLNLIGFGTQTVEEELKIFLTQNYKGRAKPVVGRLDTDTAGEARDSSAIYRDWSGGKIDILIGTQMLAKGWDISRVGLVAALLSESGLGLPDFRASERTFQVLTQAAGRAGRGKEPGHVILQTYRPDNPAIAAVRHHDYEGFFDGELKNREKFKYPPFTKLVKITVRHKLAETAEANVRKIAAKLREGAGTEIEVLGPAPGYIFRKRGLYQFHIVLKINPRRDAGLRVLLIDLANLISDIDVDPDNLL